MKFNFYYQVVDPKKVYASRSCNTKKQAKEILHERNNPRNMKPGDKYWDYWRNYKFVIRRVIEIIF